MRDYTHFHPGFVEIPGFEYRIAIMQNLYKLSEIDGFNQYEINNFCPHHDFRIKLLRLCTERTSSIAIEHIIDGIDIDVISVSQSKTLNILIPSYHKIAKTLDGKTENYWWYLSSKKMNWKKFEEKFNLATIALL